LIYLDTSAFIKLYLLEEGSAEVQRLVTGQHDPLTVWKLMELEFHNALRFKVFLAEMSGGLYHVPYLDPVTLHESALQLSLRTPALACRSPDILHVAAARLMGAQRFITADRRQAALAEGEGLPVTPQDRSAPA